MMETETMSRLYLEMSQFVPAKTAKELQLETAQTDARALVAELVKMLMRAKALKESNSVGNQGYELALDEALTKAQAFMEGRE